MNKLILLAASWCALAAEAHEGHGLPGAVHWHAGDLLLPLALVVAFAGAWWSSRRGK